MYSFIKKITPLKVKKIYRRVYDFSYYLYCFLNKKIVIHKYLDYALKIYIFNPVSRRWYNHDWIRNEINFLENGKLKKDSIVYNIGAHHGIIALIFSKIVGPNGSVIAVEMDNEHAKAAKINKRNNKANNLHVVTSAVGDKEGVLYFENDQVIKDIYRRQRKVKVTTIDSLAERYSIPSVIYIDVEGYECNVLKGAKEVLKNYPDFFIEVHVKNGLENFGGSVEKLVKYFPKNHYNFFMSEPIDDCKFREFNIKDPLVKDRFYFIAFGNNN